jgi:flagellar hook-associated protein 2
MVSSTFALFKANDPYEILISNLLQIERQPRYALEDRKTAQESYKTALSDLDSKISSLHSLLTSLTDAFNSPFDARTASPSSNDNFSVSVTDEAAFGSHSLLVQRLATADTRISQQLTGSGSTLRSFFDTNGSQTFSIEVASPTDEDPDNRVSIDVSVDPTGTTDEDILQEISDAINSAMDAAVDAGTIEDDHAALASMVNETTDTARLSLRSGQTGYANRLDFTDSAGGLLSLLQLSNNSVASGTGGGQVTAVGTSETDSTLNAKFQLDGLTLYRSSNQVTDALTGVTLDLEQVGDTAIDFSITSDTESIRSKIDDFISQYNEILSFVESKTAVDGGLDIRGQFAGDSTFRSLRFDMRNEIARMVTGQPDGAPTLLTELGIEINDDGTLELTDTDALTDALESDADAVERLFSGSDGVATRLKDLLDAYTGVNSILDNRIETVEDGIARLDDQMAEFDDRLAIRENELRKQYAKLQETMALFQGQQLFLGGFFGTF